MNTQDYYNKKNETKVKEPEYKDVTFKEVLSKSWLMLIPGFILAFMTYGILSAINPTFDSMIGFITIACTILFALILGCYRVYGTEAVQIVEPNGTIKLKKRNKYRLFLWIGIAVYVIAFIVSMSVIGARINSTPVTTGITGVSTTDTTTNSQPTTTTYGPGTLKVGVDIPAGEYVASNFTLLEISSDSSGSYESEIDNGLYGQRAYVSLYDGEYVNITSGTLTPVDQTLPWQGVLGRGTFAVGRDIPAGEYKVTSKDGQDGTIFIFEAPYGEDQSRSEAIGNQTFTDSTYITLEDGQYVFLSTYSELDPNNQ